VAIVTGAGGGLGREHALLLARLGAKHNIRVNALAPSAGTRMFEGLLPQGALQKLAPKSVSPAVAVLVAEDAPTRCILCAGAGSFERAHVTLTRGIYLGEGDGVVDQLHARMSEVSDRSGESVPEAGGDQISLELAKGGFMDGGTGSQKPRG
jgi:hypothetical protein